MKPEILERRSFLLGLGGALALGGTRMALAQGPRGDKRLVVVILRGALDGLAAVAPYGDPGFATLRGAHAPPEPGQEGGTRDLGGFFGLHPAMARLHDLYTSDRALIFHAVAGPWRSRSHFDAQDFLECGATQRLPDGWLNRALSTMPAEPPGSARRGLALGIDVPLLLRGPVRVGSFAAQGRARADTYVLAALARLHRADRELGAPFAEGLRSRGFSSGVLAGLDPPPPGTNSFVTLAGSAARLLADPRGPRVAALELGGWDTHATQGPRLAQALRVLDEGLEALRAGMGAAWTQTAVLVMTEFGRTARINGTQGTDHGTAGVAFLLGGSVRGGRVLADWPGVGPGRLFENRDLAPTLDLRRVAKGLLADHLGLDAAALNRAFPNSRDAEPLPGLVTTAT